MTVATVIKSLRRLLCGLEEMQTEHIAERIQIQTDMSLPDAYQRVWVRALNFYNRIKDEERNWTARHGQIPSRLFLSPNAPIDLRSNFAIAVYVDATLQSEEFRFE